MGCVSWSDISWTDVSWSDVSWSEVSWEDGADGEFLDGDGHQLTPEEELEAASDPDLLGPGETLPAVEPVTSTLPACSHRPRRSRP